MSLLKDKLMGGMIVHACNLAKWETEIEDHGLSLTLGKQTNKQTRNC
jgi:hypothetical protein